jgi:hypothetical protein
MGNRDSTTGNIRTLHLAPDGADLTLAIPSHDQNQHPLLVQHTLSYHIRRIRSCDADYSKAKSQHRQNSAAWSSESPVQHPSVSVRFFDSSILPEAQRASVDLMYSVTSSQTVPMLLSAWPPYATSACAVEVSLELFSSPLLLGEWVFKTTMNPHQLELELGSTTARGVTNQHARVAHQGDRVTSATDGGAGNG